MELTGPTMALCIGLFSIAVVAFSLAWIAHSYFKAVSRNPVINESVRPMLLIFIGCAEFVSLIIAVVVIIMMLKV